MTKKKLSAADFYSLSGLRKKLKKPSEYDIYPSFNRRMTAATLDSVLLMLLTPIYNYLAPIDRSALYTISEGNTDSPKFHSIISQLMENRPFVESWLSNFTLQFVFFLIYSGICWHFWSATPGKYVTGMRIVRARSHAPITPIQIFLRLCGYIPSIGCALLGILWIGLNKRHRGWHDYIAGTEVILVPYSLPWRKTATPTPMATHETPAD